MIHPEARVTNPELWLDWWLAWNKILKEEKRLEIDSLEEIVRSGCFEKIRVLWIGKCMAGCMAGMGAWVGAWVGA